MIMIVRSRKEEMMSSPSLILFARISFRLCQMIISVIEKKMKLLEGSVDHHDDWLLLLSKR